MNLSANGALLLGVAGLVTGAIAFFVYIAISAYKRWKKKQSKKSPPPKPPENMDPPELPREQVAPAPQPQKVAEPVVPTPATPTPVAPQVKKVAEYLGNSNTMEIHDLNNLKPACQINRMNEENKVSFDNIEEVKNAMESDGYNGCRWCLSQYHTD